MRLTDEEVGILAAHTAGETQQRWLKKLRERAISKLIRSLPNPTGTCPHGNKIEWDQKGSYSSGYPIGCERCINSDSFRQIVNDPPSPERQRILDEIKRLRSEDD
jgi:hypothetical protein